MPRPASGQIVEHRGSDGRVLRSLRFRYNGERRTEPLGAVPLDVAERKLRQRMDSIEEGTYTPPKPVVAAEAPTFHAFAEEWWTLSEGQWSENTQADYRWRLELHLLPYFGEMPLDEIKARTVDAYIAAKLAQEKPLSARSTNMTVTLLGAILQRAVRYELLPANPARGCRAAAREPARTYLETAAQIEALLDAAGELDRGAAKDRRHVHRRAMLATLTFAGLRISELLGLRWRDVDLAAGWLTVGESKTDAGRRKVKIRGALRDTLLTVRASGKVDQGSYVFPTRTGARLSPENFRNRVLSPAVKRANKNLAETELPPLPKLTPHSLRRTFCSLLYALGESPPVVMQEMGHTDPALALRVYAQAMRRDEHHVAQLRALVEGVDWANMGERGASDTFRTVDVAVKSAVLQGKRP